MIKTDTSAMSISCILERVKKSVFILLGVRREMLGRLPSKESSSRHEWFFNHKVSGISSEQRHTYSENNKTEIAGQLIRGRN
jgi:hypothetical protein